MSEAGRGTFLTTSSTESGVGEDLRVAGRSSSANARACRAYLPCSEVDGKLYNGISFTTYISDGGLTLHGENGERSVNPNSLAFNNSLMSLFSQRVIPPQGRDAMLFVPIAIDRLVVFVHDEHRVTRCPHVR